MPHDHHTDARRAWLHQIQFPAIAEPLQKAVLLIAFLLALIVVSHNDYEDALAIEAERDAYSQALARCSAEQAPSSTPSIESQP